MEMNSKIGGDVNKKTTHVEKEKWSKPELVCLSLTKTSADVFGEFDDGDLGFSES